MTDRSFVKKQQHAYHDFGDFNERIRGQARAMERLTTFCFLSAFLLFSSARVQTLNLPAAPSGDAPTKDIDAVRMSSKVAETLLIHREEPACQKTADGVKVKATVITAITIDKNGRVSHARTLSGPKLLRPLALQTVRKYQYKPYLLNQKPVRVETTVSISIDCFFHTGQA
jgi:Periplasmic protein TonB, links inner and outer membranes